MRRNAILAGAVVAAFAATGLSAQDAPSFAGSWTMVASPDGGAGGGRGGFGGLGQAVTIAQDGATLTITRTTPAGETESVYKLDGSESTNTLSFGGNSIDQVSTANWEGSSLVVTTEMDMGGNAFQTTMILSLDADGNLVVESTRPGRGGGPATTTTSTYTKD
jgi:hypothetical protein